MAFIVAPFDQCNSPSSTINASNKLKLNGNGLPKYIKRGSEEGTKNHKIDSDSS